MIYKKKNLYTPSYGALREIFFSRIEACAEKKEK